MRDVIIGDAEATEEQKKRMTKMEETLAEQQAQLRQQQRDMQEPKDRPSQPAFPALPAGADNPAAQLLQLTDGDAEHKYWPENSSPQTSWTNRSQAGCCRTS